MSRILICESRRRRPDWWGSLDDEGYDTTVCAGREALFDALAAKRPDVIIYALGDLTLDLGVLWVVRRIAPTLPIILLGGPAGLEVRRSVQELKPAYFGMFPLEPAELSDAVRSVLRHDNGRALAS